MNAEDGEQNMLSATDVNSLLSEQAEQYATALRIAAGYISTFEPHRDQHPEDVFNWLLEQATEERERRAA